jgi:hypothetical protein
MLGRRGGCRLLQPTRPTPRWHRRQAVAPAGFGLLPVRSPLLRESSLFLGVLRCFSSPGALLSYLRCPAVRRAGCPIRTSPDRRLPAPPRGISPRGRVLPRPPTPRHPPCAHHADILRPFPTGCCRDHASRPARASGTVPSSQSLPAAALPRSPVGSWCVFVCFCVCVFDGTLQCARASRHEPPHPTGLPVWSRTRVTMPRRDVRRTPSGHRRLPRPQNPAGSAWRIVKVPEDPTVVLTTHPSSRRPRGLPVCEVVKPRPKPSSDLGRDLPTPTRSPDRSWRDEGGQPTIPARVSPPRWSRGDSNPGPPPCKGGALPAKLRPRQQRPGAPGSPPPAPGPHDRTGGRAWTRTRDLGLIRAAL